MTAHRQAPVFPPRRLPEAAAARNSPARFQRVHRRGLLAQRFGQTCTVALAAFVTSGTGLLTYNDVEPSPAWLRLFVLLSVLTTVITFVGWVVASLAEQSRQSL